MSTTTDSISIQAAKEHPLPSYQAGQQIGGYEVVEAVSEGMLGAVYKVRHVKTGKVAALKLIRPEGDTSAFKSDTGAAPTLFPKSGLRCSCKNLAVKRSFTSATHFCRLS